MNGNNNIGNNYNNSNSGSSYSPPYGTELNALIQVQQQIMLQLQQQQALQQQQTGNFSNEASSSRQPPIDRSFRQPPIDPSFRQPPIDPSFRQPPIDPSFDQAMKSFHQSNTREFTGSLSDSKDPGNDRYFGDNRNENQDYSNDSAGPNVGDLGDLKDAPKIYKLMSQGFTKEDALKALKVFKDGQVVAQKENEKPGTFVCDKWTKYSSNPKE